MGDICVVLCSSWTVSYLVCFFCQGRLDILAEAGLPILITGKDMHQLQVINT